MPAAALRQLGRHPAEQIATIAMMAGATSKLIEMFVAEHGTDPDITRWSDRAVDEALALVVGALAERRGPIGSHLAELRDAMDDRASDLRGLRRLIEAGEA